MNNLQRDAFLSGEGDAWFSRNYKDDSSSSLTCDLLAPLLQGIPLANSSDISVVELGCGQGLRLSALSKTRKWSLCGVDPSLASVSHCQNRGLRAFVGTADKLEIESNSVDLLIYGFCLYLCDRSDLFSIAAEANRVLKSESWIAILDFWSPNHHSNSYHHKPGLKSFKMDNSAMFTWHPNYMVVDHCVRHHNTHEYTDNSHYWISSTILRKSDFT